MSLTWVPFTYFQPNTAAKKSSVVWLRKLLRLAESRKIHREALNAYQRDHKSILSLSMIPMFVCWTILLLTELKYQATLIEYYVSSQIDIKEHGKFYRASGLFS